MKKLVILQIVFLFKKENSKEKNHSAFSTAQKFREVEGVEFEKTMLLRFSASSLHKRVQICSSKCVYVRPSISRLALSNRAGVART